MSLVRCPTCNKLFDPAQSRAMPFCSDRCRRIDLNRWLNEEISMPISSDESEAEREAGPSEAEQN